ncbi:colicin D domain-containing protein [Anthocerotibacter panamensis]|uniref:colicin D domain-containing protein n=1 Tax=Anthocerotibacter panamensis TaxID=2857077 RepID=UPI001C407A5C|nr:colicin D domain-containing protein [Anthocerotibacter panamensis]
MSIYESRKPKSSFEHSFQPPKPSTFKPPPIQAQPVEDEPPMPTYTPLPDDFLTNNPFQQVPGEPASGQRRLSPIRIPSVSAEVQRQELVQLNPLKGAAKADEALELAQKELLHLNREMALEMAQAAADLAGIADPTPISDGISAAISLAKGNYLGAGLSLVSMVPYLGDAVGKSIKAARNAKQVGKLVERIREVSTRLQHLSGGARRTALPEVAAKVGEALGTEGRQVIRGYTPKPGERATTREAWQEHYRRGRTEQLSIGDKQLQKKFKHAVDFGITGSFNSENAQLLRSAIETHIRDSSTKMISGMYRGQNVVHFVNPQSGLNVIRDLSGNFLSGWKLNSQQLNYVLTKGSL